MPVGIPHTHMELSGDRPLEGREPLSWPGRRAWIGLASLAVLGIGLRGLAIANTSQTSVGNRPLPDDAFYYFVLARNLASGNGLSISGNGIATTGFQPLWAGLLALLESVAGGFDPQARILVAQSLGAILGVAAAALLFLAAWRLTGDDRPALLAAGAFLLSPQIVKHNLNGMETSLALLGLGFLIVVGLNFSPLHARRGMAFLVGAGCGLTILARIDLAALVGLLTVWWVVKVARGGRGWDRLISVGLGIGMALAPWFFVALRTGSGLIPESGQAVRNLTLLLHDLPLMGFVESLREAPEVFLSVYLRYAIEFTSAWVRQVPVLLPLTLPIFAWLPANAAEDVTAGLALLLAIGAGLAAARSRHRLLREAVLLGEGLVLLLTAAYATVVLGPWFFQRYAAPAGVVVNLLLLAGLAMLISRSRASISIYRLAAFGIAVGFTLMIWEGNYRWIVAGKAAVPDDGFHRAAQAIEARLPAKARVGVFSAGLIAYSVPQPIVALDGKVNRLARQAMREGRMFEYVCSDGIEYVADWEKMIDRLLIRRSDGWQVANLSLLETIRVDDGNDIQIYQVNREACPDGSSLQ